MTAPHSTTTTDVPVRLTRLGVVMSADPDNDFEVEGVLNPASGRSPDGRLWLLPRLVAASNVSRVGLAEIVVEDGIPAGGTPRGCRAGSRRRLGTLAPSRRRGGSPGHLDTDRGIACDELRGLRSARA